MEDERKIVKNCLCLKQLHSIYINQKEVTISDKENRRTVKYDKNRHEFFLYVHPIKVDNYLAIHQRKKTKDVFMAQSVEYLIPFEEESQGYYVYSTFPTQERVNIPMIINMPLELDTARERIQDGEWNKEIIRQMMEGLLPVYDKLKYIEKERLPLYFPKDGSVLYHKYGKSPSFLNRLAYNNIFKLALKNDYVSLKTGVFSRNFEYGLFAKYGASIGGGLQNNLLAKDDNALLRLKQLYVKDEIKERRFEDICVVLDNLFISMRKQDKDPVADKEFREKLYDFLADSPDRNDKQAMIVKNWEIIPIKFQKKTKYEKFSEEIYAPGKENIDSEKYKILDKQILSIEKFSKIYSYITGEYKPLKEFTKDVIIAEFFEEIQAVLQVKSDEERVVKILELYRKEKNLFEETYKKRKDFPADKMCFKTKASSILSKSNCYICKDEKSQGCLDKIIVSDEYQELARLMDVKDISTIESYKQIYFEIGRKELAELNKNSNLTKKAELFSSLYHYRDRSEELKDGMGFFELYLITPLKVRTRKDQDEKVITITEEILQLYSNEINEISIGKIPISCKVEFELFDFEKDNILAEIEDELQIRKETEKLNLIMGMLSNCSYAMIQKREPCCIRTKNRSLLLLDSKITADYDIIETLKAYFLKYFNTELSINRNIRLYSRRGFENISTIESSKDDVIAAVSMMTGINLTNLEEIKNFVCRPIVLKGITYGGYAKTCPLCGTRIDTELTGMRIYKTKANGVIIPLISCSNCHESLRYSSYINIDT